jgi:hypothetical protein
LLLQGVLEKLLQNPMPSLAARIRELEVVLAREGDRHMRMEIDLRESLKVVHAQLNEQWDSFIEERMQLQASFADEKKKL